jgi:hypothetical protein
VIHFTIVYSSAFTFKYNSVARQIILTKGKYCTLEYSATRIYRHSSGNHEHQKKKIKTNIFFNSREICIFNMFNISVSRDFWAEKETRFSDEYLCEHKLKTMPKGDYYKFLRLIHSEPKFM